MEMFVTEADQLELWLMGKSIHTEDGCVPDFSCCAPSLQASLEERWIFVNSYQEKRYDICRGMWLIFLSKRFPKENIEGFYSA